jgi:hypothetical protein
MMSIMREAVLEEEKSLYQLLCRQLRYEEKACSVEDVCIAAGLLVAMPARLVSQ